MILHNNVSFVSFFVVVVVVKLSSCAQGNRERLEDDKEKKEK